MRAQPLDHRPKAFGCATRATLASALALVLGLSFLGACKEEPSEAPSAPEEEPAPPRPALLPALSALESAAAPKPAVAPSSSAGALLLRSVQASKLDVPPRADQLPGLALTRTALGRLTPDGWEIRALSDFHVLASRPLAHPLAVLGLADGALLALDTERSERFDPATKRAKELPGLPLFPGTKLYADAQQPDRIWTLEGSDGKAARLSSYRLALGDAPPDTKLVLPEATAELGEGAAHRFGVTREGVFLHLLRGRVERWGPGGARLAALRVPDADLPTWSLPAKRLDQALWVRESGAIERVWLSVPFKELGRAQLAGRPVTVAVGNRGELLAAVVVTGPGPRFELELMDADLNELGRASLPGDAPSGNEDWVRVVTDNQQLAVSSTGNLVAVGGPERVRIFDGQAHELFSIPSR